MKTILFLFAAACGDNIEVSPDASVDAAIDATIDATIDAEEPDYCELSCRYSLSPDHYQWCLDICYANCEAGFGDC
jgi:hypothetical protein